MHYKILARSWRPKSFCDVIGQTNIITALSNSFKLNRIHQSWIFSGNHGVGKTTVARLLSKSLNCENKKNIHFCNICSNCQDFKKKCFSDFIEIDAASKTKVEDIKELLNTSKYLPIKGKYKIYLIDETHMLSKHSFNSLLKVLEEPPEYIRFILITTEINKIPKTIISRCMHLHFKKIHDSEIHKHLLYILKTEKIFFEEEAIQIIAINSQGSIRDALNLTEKAIMMNYPKITKKNIMNMFGMLNKHQILSMIIAIFNKDSNQLINILESIYCSDINLEHILVEILKIFHSIAILKCSPKNKIQNSTYHLQLLSISQSIKYSDLQNYYSIILNGRKNITIAPNIKIAIEMTLLNLLHAIKHPIY